MNHLPQSHKEITKPVFDAYNVKNCVASDLLDHYIQHGSSPSLEEAAMVSKKITDDIAFSEALSTLEEINSLLEKSKGEHPFGCECNNCGPFDDRMPLSVSEYASEAYSEVDYHDDFDF